MTQGPFYSGDDDGVELLPSTFPHSFTFNVDATGVFSGYSISSAKLFIDAENVDPEDSGQVFVQGSLMSDPLFSNVPGGVGGCSSAEAVNSISRIPCVGGGTMLPLRDEDDNSFYLLSPAQANTLATDTTWTVEINNNYPKTSDPARRFRVDGINIQADVRLLAGDVVAPEPTSFLLFGLGGLLAGATRRRRQMV